MVVMGGKALLLNPVTYVASAEEEPAEDSVGGQDAPFREPIDGDECDPENARYIFRRKELRRFLGECYGVIHRL